MERERAVRCRAMKIDCRAEDRHLNQDDRNNDAENQRIKHASTSKP